jgi:hypothetical protein
MHQLLVHADDVNLLGDNIDNIKKSTRSLIYTSKEVGLEVNTEKSTCCCLVSKMQCSQLNTKTHKAGESQQDFATAVEQLAHRAYPTLPEDHIRGE